jgi:hypothetical protein
MHTMCVSVIKRVMKRSSTVELPWCARRFRVLFSATPLCDYGIEAAGPFISLVFQTGPSEGDVTMSCWNLEPCCTIYYILNGLSRRTVDRQSEPRPCPRSSSLGADDDDACPALRVSNCENERISSFIKRKRFNFCGLLSLFLT